MECQSKIEKMVKLWKKFYDSNLNEDMTLRTLMVYRYDDYDLEIFRTTVYQVDSNNTLISTENIVIWGGKDKKEIETYSITHEKYESKINSIYDMLIKSVKDKYVSTKEKDFDGQQQTLVETQ